MSTKLDQWIAHYEEGCALAGKLGDLHRRMAELVKEMTDEERKELLVLMVRKRNPSS